MISTDFMYSALMFIRTKSNKHAKFVEVLVDKGIEGKKLSNDNARSMMIRRGSIGYAIGPVGNPESESHNSLKDVTRYIVRTRD